MSFLAPILSSLAGPLLGKLFRFKKGGEIRTKKGQQAVVVVHDGEMIVPKKDVPKVKKAMTKNSISIPKPKTIGVRGRGKRKV